MIWEENHGWLTCRWAELLGFVGPNGKGAGGLRRGEEKYCRLGYQQSDAVSRVTSGQLSLGSYDSIL